MNKNKLLLVLLWIFNWNHIYSLSIPSNNSKIDSQKTNITNEQEDNLFTKNNNPKNYNDNESESTEDASSEYDNQKFSHNSIKNESNDLSSQANPKEKILQAEDGYKEYKFEENHQENQSVNHSSKNQPSSDKFNDDSGVLVKKEEKKSQYNIIKIIGVAVGIVVVFFLIGWLVAINDNKKKQRITEEEYNNYIKFCETQSATINPQKFDTIKFSCENDITINIPIFNQEYFENRPGLQQIIQIISQFYLEINQNKHTIYNKKNLEDTQKFDNIEELITQKRQNLDTLNLKTINKIFTKIIEKNEIQKIQNNLNNKNNYYMENINENIIDKNIIYQLTNSNGEHKNYYFFISQLYNEVIIFNSEKNIIFSTINMGWNTYVQKINDEPDNFNLDLEDKITNMGCSVQLKEQSLELQKIKYNVNYFPDTLSLKLFICLKKDTMYTNKIYTHTISINNNFNLIEAHIVNCFQLIEDKIVNCLQFIRFVSQDKMINNLKSNFNDSEKQILDYQNFLKSILIKNNIENNKTIE